MAEITRSEIHATVLNVVMVEATADTEEERIEQDFPVKEGDLLSVLAELDTDCDISLSIPGEDIVPPDTDHQSDRDGRRVKIWSVIVRRSGIAKISGLIRAAGNRIKIQLVAFSQDVVTELTRYMTPQNKCKICRFIVSHALKAVLAAHGIPWLLNLQNHQQVGEWVVEHARNLYDLADQRFGLGPLIRALENCTQGLPIMEEAGELLKVAVRVLELDPVAWTSKSVCRVARMCEASS